MAEQKRAAGCAWAVWALGIVALVFPAGTGSLGAAARASTDATIAGVIKDQSGQPIPGAQVTLKEGTSGITVRSATDRAGTFTFSGVSPGTYFVTAEAEGFKQARPMRVTVAAQARKSVDIVMEIAGNPSAGNPPPRSKDASSIASPEFYDEPAFKPGPLASSGEAAGYSAGSQGEVAHRLLADFMNMQAGIGPEDAGKELQSLSHPEGSTTADRSLSSKEYEAAVEKEPSEANFFAWGDALLRQNAYAKAEEAFSRGVQRYHTSLRLQLALAVAQYLRGDYAKSVNILILASDSAPSDYRPYILLGKAYSGAMVPESAQAIETLRRFMQVQPQNALAHYYFALGLSKGVRGKNDESRWAEVEAALERAQKLDPQLADAHLLLGSTYEERGRLAEAVAQYEQTARLRPDLPAAHYRLSKLYLRQGDKARADAELAKFEKLTHPN